MPVSSKVISMSLGGSVRAAIRSRVEDKERAARIRTRLLNEAPSDGIVDKVSALKILTYPALQLILMDERTDFDTRRDESLKLLSLAPWQIDAIGEPKPGDGLFADFLPGVVAHRRAQARIEQRIALLRCVEAIRHYAANQDGKLPEKFESLALPLPTDPFTGKAFGYSVTGTLVHLTGDGKSYEISLKK